MSQKLEGKNAWESNFGKKWMFCISKCSEICFFNAFLNYINFAISEIFSVLLQR